MLWVILTTFSIACSLREFKNPLLMDFWTKYNQTYLKRAADWHFLSVWSVSLWRSLLPVLCELRNEFSPITNYWIHKRGDSRSHLHNVTGSTLSQTKYNINIVTLPKIIINFLMSESVCSFSVFHKAVNL